MYGYEKFDFRRIWVLGFGFLGISLLWSAYDDYVPVLLQAGRPDFSKGAGVSGFGLEAGVSGLVMALDNLAAIFILPYVGGLSDRLRSRWGRRKPFILVGAPIAAVALAAVPFMLGKPLWLFMAAIIVTLLAMDLFRTPVVSLMGDLTPPAHRSRSNGIINFMGGLGTVIASYVGGKLFGLTPAGPFLLGAAGMLIAQLILVATVREPADPEGPDADEEPDPEEPVAGLLPSLFVVLRDPDRSTVRLLAAILFWFLGQSAMSTWFTSFAIQELGMNAGQASILKMWFSLSALASALPCGVIGARIGRVRAIRIGLVLFAVAMVAAYFAGSAGALRPVLIAGGFAWMLVVVNSLPLVLDFAPTARVGTYTGLYYLASQTAAFLGPILSGYLFELFANDYRMVYPYSAAFLTLAAAMMLGVRRPAPAPQ
jgi:maltose/moltooligosaccharide transporter